jgi:hypothetical protein
MSDKPSRPPIRYDVPMGMTPKPCSGPTCGAPLYWLVMPKSGKRMPIDCREEFGGRPPTASASGHGIPHWGTCPDRDRFKR